MKQKSPFGLIVLDGDSLRARTPDPLIKSQMGMMRIIQYLQVLFMASTFSVRPVARPDRTTPAGTFRSAVLSLDLQNKNADLIVK